MIIELSSGNLDLGEQVAFSAGKIEQLNALANSALPNFYIFPHYNPVYRDESESYEALTMCAFNNLYALTVDCGKVMDVMLGRECRLLTDKEKSDLRKIKNLVCCLRTYHDHNAAKELHTFNQDVNRDAKEWLNAKDWRELLLELVNDGETIWQKLQNAVEHFATLQGDDRAAEERNWRKAILSFANHPDLVYKRLKMKYKDTWNRQKGNLNGCKPNDLSLGRWLERANGQNGHACFATGTPPYDLSEEEDSSKRENREKRREKELKNARWYIDWYKEWVKKQTEALINDPNTKSFLPEELLSAVMEPLVIVPTPDR